MTTNTTPITTTEGTTMTNTPLLATPSSLALDGYYSCDGLLYPTNDTIIADLLKDYGARSAEVTKYKAGYEAYSKEAARLAEQQALNAATVKEWIYAVWDDVDQDKLIDLARIMGITLTRKFRVRINQSTYYSDRCLLEFTMTTDDPEFDEYRAADQILEALNTDLDTSIQIPIRPDYLPEGCETEDDTEFEIWHEINLDDIWEKFSVEVKEVV